MNNDQEITPMKKKFVLIPVIIIGLILTPIIAINSYPIVIHTYQNITIKPFVRITNTTYDEETVQSTFWDHPKFDEFEKYSNTYTDSLRKAAIKSIKEQAEGQGEDPEVISKCLESTGITEGDSKILPSVAEKGFYRFPMFMRWRYVGPAPRMNDSDLNNISVEPCWIFVVNWASSSHREAMGHIRIYVISTIDYTKLFYLSCT